MTRHLAPIALVLALITVTACQPAAGGDAKPSASSVAASPAIAPATWLTGRWVGNHEGTVVEETWGPAHGTSMIGTMRVIDEDKPAFYELIVLEDRDGAAFMGLAHFRPGLAPTKSPTLQYKLASSTDRELLFEVQGADDVKRIRYTRDAKDENALAVRLERDDGADELLFTRSR